MSSNPYSSLNRRPGGGGAAASSSSLFAGYNPSSRPSSQPSKSQSRPGAYSYSYSNTQTPARSASPYSSSSTNKPAANGKLTPPPFPSSSSHPQSQFDPDPQSQNSSQAYHLDARGRHSTSLLESLESQNENEATSLLSSKVAQLKQLTVQIGDEIRDSSSLAATINDQFEGAGVRLRGTMRRMLRMAERTGVGWRVWLGFFAVVWLLFVYVWMF